MKIQVFWDVTTRQLVNNYRHLEGMHYFLFLLEMLNLEDDITFLRNFGIYLPIGRNTPKDLKLLLPVCAFPYSTFLPKYSE
jgi:hypothetical protein